MVSVARKSNAEQVEPRPPTEFGSGWSSNRRGRKIAELLARDIVTDVVSRDLQPGDMLPAEAEMIRTYQVGRATLREALRLLEAQGLIWVKPGPGGGPVLGQLTPRHFGDMAKLHLQIAGATFGEVLQARLAIEPLMARLAATAQDPVGLARLRAHIAEVDGINLEDDVAYQEMSWSFHATVASISGNRVLDLMGEALKEVYDSKVRAAVMAKRLRSDVREAHRAIADAICEGRGDDAERLMREHMVQYGNWARRRDPRVFDETVVWD